MSSPHRHRPAKGHSDEWCHGRNNKEQYGTGQGNNNSSWLNFQNNNRHPSLAKGILGRPSFTSAKQCQMCFHYNHIALESRNKFNHSFVANNIP